MLTGLERLEAMRRQVATHPTACDVTNVEYGRNKSLFASFSSEKEDSFLLRFVFATLKTENTFAPSAGFLPVRR
jgi:hypothetical protein